MKPNETKQLTMEYVISLMDKSYELEYVDYRESLEGHEDLLQKCIDEKSPERLYDKVCDWYMEARWNGACEVVKQLKKRCIGQGYAADDVESFFEEQGHDLRYEVLDRDQSDVLDGLCRNTRPLPIRVTLGVDGSEPDSCIGSNWAENSYGGYRYKEYFKRVVDVLRLNPAKVKAYLVDKGEKVAGRFPNKKERDGKELISYQSFYEELLNCCSEVNQLTFIAAISARDLIDAAFDVRSITIPAGNYAGLFSSCQGGGSIFEMKLLNDFHIDLSKGWGLCMDVKNRWGYTVQEVYGVCDDFFGSEVKDVA